MTWRTQVAAFALGLTGVLLCGHLAPSSLAQEKDKAKDKDKAPDKKPAPPSFKIPDKNLEAALRAVLFEPQGELTEEKLNRVYILDAQGKTIKDLTGLEKCKNL